MSPAGDIGRAGHPVRALSFSTGLFDTAMQLGVAHALLVIRGRAPDVVVGISAGAVNAASVAEILQAGTPVPDRPHPEATAERHRARREARVARFREIFTEFQQAPAALVQALLPDTYQVQARRPLAPIRLPIHASRERADRSNAVAARAGLINLLNTLLGLRVTFGTLTRATRRALGIWAAGAVAGRAARWAAMALEGIHAFNLLGAHLHEVGPLVYPFALRPLAGSFTRPPREKPQEPARQHGGTAASLIFQSWWLPTVRALGQRLLGLVVLWALWLGAGVVGLPLAALVALGGVGPGWRNLSEQAQTGRLGLLADLVRSVAQALLLMGLWTLPLLTALALLHSGRPGCEVLTLAWPTLRGCGVGSALVSLSLVLLAVLLAAIVAVLLYTRRGGSPLSWFTERTLASYRLSESLLSVHPLREIFVRVFDRDYYGARDMDVVVDRALADHPGGSTARPVTSERRPRKTVDDYGAGSPPVHVGLAVADVKSGNVTVVPPGTSVVDGLLAATSLVPVFPATRLPTPTGEALYVDGGNVANEPTHPLMNLLRGRVHPDATEVHVYSVSPLPVSQGQVGHGVGETPPIYHSLIDVAGRAMNLQRLRDAMLERRLTHLYTRVIPPGKAGVRHHGRDFYRVWIAPVEPDQPLEVTRRYFSQDTEEDRQRLIRETVADGCRAALEVMLRSSLPDGEATVSCPRAVTHHFEAKVADLAAARPDLLDPLTGSSTADTTPGPGLPEVCAHCILCRGSAQAAPQTLRVRSWNRVMPAWPVEGEPEAALPPLEEAPFRAPSAYRQRTADALQQFRARLEQGTDEAVAWPRARGAPPGVPPVTDRTRPVVSLLFSGGVFRGVYQMGVLNALSEVDLRPDIVAGASIGSITAAMVAEAFAEQSPAARRTRVARLAATYLALDKLIMTDRFADFIRTLTIRAAETHFSIREADRVFRRYDMASTPRFGAEARRVAAGLERLFYVSPPELMQLVKALRLGQAREVTRLLRAYAEEWLDRMEVGNQVLGAGPLTMLILEHVLGPMSGTGRVPEAPEQIGFDAFLRRSGVFFLATATNLSQGRLEILGEQQPMGEAEEANLLNGLLASSAFPGVFRPRWSWEVMPGTRLRHQYIDGGVFDNLPLDAVAQFLRQAAAADLVAARPAAGGGAVPHLLFAASLEVEPERDPSPADMRRFGRYWPATRRRAGQLGYNRKLDLYQITQRNIRLLWQRAEPRPPWTPLDLEVVTVRPNWLCRTFAFHPMLGFRRAAQAASIAHGCATTLLELGRLARDPTGAGWLRAWGVDPAALPADPPAARTDPIVPPRLAPHQAGSCYWRPGTPCPFSRGAVASLDLGEFRNTETALESIYHACGDRRTHASREG